MTERADYCADDARVYMMVRRHYKKCLLLKVFTIDLFCWRLPALEDPMRAEAQKLSDGIEEAFALLRRAL